jgi:hypothetical protein
VLGPRHSWLSGSNRTNNGRGDTHELSKLALTSSRPLAAAGLSPLWSPRRPPTQAKEQFFPVLVYRTGAYAPNGAQWANGYVDYLKLVNARGGINGVKISFEECETATRPTAASNATSA